MHSNYLEAFGSRVIIFGSIPKSRFLRVFEVFLDLVVLVYFNAISIFLCGKELNLHLFFVISMFVSGRMHIVEI